MKKCFRCGTAWTGYRPQPHSRSVCEGCGSYLHACVNCHQFDHVISSACKLPNTAFVGARDSLNYCEEFRMFDCTARASEDRVIRAKHTWEQLFRP